MGTNDHRKTGVWVTGWVEGGKFSRHTNVRGLLEWKFTKQNRSYSPFSNFLLIVFVVFFVCF